MTAPPGWRAPWDILARDISPLPAGTSLEAQTAPLLENLARATGTGYAALWVPAGPSKPASGWTVLLGHQARPGSVLPAALRAGPSRDVAALSDRPGVRALMGVPDGGQTVCVIMVGDPDGGPAARAPGQLLEQTRDCLALLLREGRLNATLHGQLALADRLAQRSARVEADLARVRQAERDRLAGWILAGTTRQLAEVTRRWQDFDLVVREDPDHALGGLRRLRAATDELINDFRTVVRAVHPSMLRSRGTAAALSELAAQLPGGVRITGDLGRRVGWEVESGLYHAAAAALTALHETGGVELSMRFTRVNGQLGVRVSDRSARPPGERSLDELHAGLADDARRMAALGGGLRCHVSARGTRTVGLWLPERLSGADDALSGGPLSGGPLTNDPPTNDPRSGVAAARRSDRDGAGDLGPLARHGGDS